MTTALFINEQYLRDFTPLSANIDIKMIFPHCRSVQDTAIQDILGTSLYNTLQDRVTNNNADANETILLDLCRSALAWLTVAKMLPFVSIQIRNIGTVQTNTDNGNVASIEQMKYIRNEAQTTAEFYLKRLSDYLIFNGNLFPDYIHPDLTKMIPRSQDPYDCDLWTGNSGDFDAMEFWKRYLR